MPEAPYQYVAWWMGNYVSRFEKSSFFFLALLGVERGGGGPDVSPCRLSIMYIKGWTLETQNN